MTTKNKNIEDSTTILDMYKDLGVSFVSEQVIVVDHSRQRADYAKLFYIFLVCFPLVMAVLSYNTMDLIGFISTVIAVVIFFTYLKYEHFIWSKQIHFDKVKGTISYKRYFPKKDIVFNYDTIYFRSKTQCVKNHCSLHFYIAKQGQDIEKEKKHALFTSYIYATDKDKSLFISLLKQFMKQDAFPERLELLDNTKK